jgi:hypothetical protein
MTSLRLGDRSTARVFEYEGRFYAHPLGRGCGISLGDDPMNDEELCDVVYDILRFDFDRKTEGYGRIRIRIEVESMD